MTAVLGNTLVTSVFGVAAFAQPAIGRAYLAGQTAEAEGINSAIYGPALFATALPGLVLLTVGIVLAGVAVARSGSLPKLASIGQRTGPLAGTRAPLISHTLGWSANLLVDPCPRAASTEKTDPRSTLSTSTLRSSRARAATACP